MTKHLSIAAAAALAVAGISFNANAQDTAETTTTDNPNALERAADKTGNALENAAEKTGDALDTAGERTRDALRVNDRRVTAGQAPSAEEIHDVLAQVTEAAMTKGGLDDMVERFVDADRNRLGQNEAVLDETDALDARIAQLRDDFKTRYNTEFDIEDEDALYGQGFAMINEGEIGQSARTAGERVGADETRVGDRVGERVGERLETDDTRAGERLNADGTRVGDTAAGTANVGGVGADANVNTEASRATVDVDNNTGVDAPRVNTDGQTAADRNLNDPGRNIAQVKIAAKNGLPELTVPMIREAGGWKIDIPDTVDAAKLRENVENALARSAETKDQWPADANDAYRAATHMVLLSIFDKPLTNDAQSAGSTETPSAQPAANPQ